MSINVRTLLILGFLLGILSLTILPWSCTCSCSSDSGIGGDWNPLYHKIVFCRYCGLPDTNSDIYIVDVNGLVNLTNTPKVREFTPSWSPDGTKIAFIISQDGYTDIYVMNTDGSGAVNLTNTPDWYERIPSWSPDGTRIAYTRRESPSNYYDDIFVMDADGTNKTNLTDTPDIDESWVNWLPDSMKISFRVSSDLYVINIDGTNKTQLASGNRFRWSPDCSKIAFTEDIWEEGNVHVVDADGSNVINVTNPSVVLYDPTIEWSPDNSKIVFIRGYEDGDDYDTEICVVNADGSGLTNLTNTPEIMEGGPRWSPDGSKIIFEFYSHENQGIYVMDADGSNSRPLAVTGYPAFLEPGDPPPAIFYYHARWSSDGIKIAFLSTEYIEYIDGEGGFVRDIHVVNNDGSNLKNVTNFSPDDEFQEIVSLEWMPQ